MKAKVREKELAIKLRKQGLSYEDILRQVNVAKSSLSLWLKDLPLTNEEKKVLKKRKDSNISRGRINAAAANRRNKLDREAVWLKEAKEEFSLHSKDPFFHVGIALYWAEGSKRNNVVTFTNSDERMMELFILWVEKFINIKRSDLYFQLYIHRAYSSYDYERYWSKRLKVSLDSFRKNVIKENKSLVKRRPGYRGCLRVSVPKSSGLLYKMKVWHNALAHHHGVSRNAPVA